jgi:hypothetical protein
MTAEIDQDEKPNSIAKELLELGLIHEVIFVYSENRRCAEKTRVTLVSPTSF